MRTAALALLLLMPAWPGATVDRAAGGAPEARAPGLQVRTVASGLDIAWDVAALPGTDALLATERDRKRLLVVSDDGARPLQFPAGQIWSGSETGLMALAVDPGFADSRRFYTCAGARTSGGRDIRVRAWTLDAGLSTATPVGTLLTGLPVTSGRHGGCRLLLDRRDGAMWVGTGDAAVGRNPRNLRSLGGKVLRLDPATGKAWPSNPYADAKNRNKRYVVSYGHRNVQGLAQRADGSIWSVEHGPDRDDEVNLVRPRADFGWNPVPGYNESVPMTDQSLPGRQRRARWSSGRPTLATSGAAWVPATGWGRYSGTLAVAALKGSRLLFMRFDASGRHVRTSAPKALRKYGRLRSVTALADGDLLVTTANGGGQDRILRVSPR